MEDMDFMQEALRLAKEAAEDAEVPVGCVIVRGGEIVGRGRNCRETAKTALGHAQSHNPQALLHPLPLLWQGAKPPA